MNNIKPGDTQRLEWGGERKYGFSDFRENSVVSDIFREGDWLELGYQKKGHLDTG